MQAASIVTFFYPELLIVLMVWTCGTYLFVALEYTESILGFVLGPEHLFTPLHKAFNVIMAWMCLPEVP